MKRFSILSLVFSLTAVLFFCGPAFGDASGKISAAEYQAGETIAIEGVIESGQELYVTIAQKKTFAPKDTNGTHEVKRLKKDAKKSKFNQDTAIPPLYYVVTTDPAAFGSEGKKRFGGPSVLLSKGQGIYSTTMFYLKKKFFR